MFSDFDSPSLVLFQPDIPQNAGALIRLSACMNIRLDVIEPCGFLWDERRMRRAGMDYVDHAHVARHRSYGAFLADHRARLPAGRLILLTTKGETSLDQFRFLPHDRLMLGRESAGVPDDVAQDADIRMRIPMAGGVRSLNVAQSATLALGALFAQLNLWPKESR